WGTRLHSLWTSWKDKCRCCSPGLHSRSCPPCSSSTPGQRRRRRLQVTRTGVGDGQHHEAQRVFPCVCLGPGSGVLGFGVLGLGFWVWSSGSRVLGFGVLVLEFWVWSSGFWGSGSGVLDFGVLGLEFWVWFGTVPKSLITFQADREEGVGLRALSLHLNTPH
ncbi:hypothetical protein ANANG_G00242560, partial [Anguilla anguilla]